MALKTLELPIQGMDCAECTRHVKHAIEQVDGVEMVEVYLASEMAIIQHQAGALDEISIRKAVASAGYSVADPREQSAPIQTPPDYTRSILSLLGLLFGVILFIIVVGEWLGLFAAITAQIPWPVSLLIVILIGYPVFLNVIRATLNRQIIAHSLMSLGVIAAIAVGEWATGAVVAFFMRVGDYVEKFTTERARSAVKDLSSLAPQTARLVKDDQEIEVPVGQVNPGDLVIIRPGEQIPVDGEVIAGHAFIDQATITGESLPIEAGPGAQVFAATLASQGTLRVQVTRVGKESTYGKVIKLVQEAEAQRGEIQRLADKFSAYYLPVVIAVALLTLLVRRDPMATAAVLVVACSCAFALATPIAILASVGAGAKQGILIKGGKYLELIPEIDTLLIDKTGTLTLGKPYLTDVIPLVAPDNDQNIGFDHSDEAQLLLLSRAASAERYSEHPLAEAVRFEAVQRGIALLEPENFESIPGLGVKADLDGDMVAVGSRRLLESINGQVPEIPGERQLLDDGKTLLYVIANGQPCGLLAAADRLRPEVPQAIESIRALGIEKIELLTGDNQVNASRLAQQLGVSFQAELLPEDKIRVVREYQADGHRVLMVGDGINDAPAISQADIGIAMGAAGHNVAMEAAHIVLMRPDWELVPMVLQIGRRTTRTIKGNIIFTLAYNFIGLSLAALGYLPPILAAAAQSIPDLAILANSSRLIRQK
jgi:Cd2+/Zn2+-exporting ATPase/Cu+-exporting ATPase